ncbi:MAG: M48 family metalloprotease [Candidatus Eremiobacteraeota bacterium]|nr:M48 family metalloprotease [Candidatus Eremiobacteraeota bacterium]
MNGRKVFYGVIAGAGASYSLVRLLQTRNVLRRGFIRTKRDAASYGRLRRAITACGDIRSIASTAAFAYGPLASALSHVFEPLPRWVRPGAFFATAALIDAAFSLPVEFIEDYALERTYGLSEQEPAAWFVESCKGVGLGVALAGALGLLSGAVIRRFPQRWPAAASVLLLPLLVAANVAVPLYVLPLFNTFEPLQGPLERRLRTLASRFGVGNAAILRMDMSRQTTKANAFVAGVGRTHRIVLGDTLVDRFEDAEIEFVVAHELGHYVSKDTWRTIAAAQCSACILFFSAQAAVDARRADDSIVLLRIYAVLSCGSFLLRPLANAFSRSREWAADRFAAAATSDPTSGAAALRRLRDQNLAQDDIPSWFEFLFASHPSLGKRIHALEHS